MSLTRHNILDLIGTGKFHSCLFTTFSFDFTFFELKVMRGLRSAGIKNIVVLMDAKMLHKLALQSTGTEFTLASGYSLYPVESKGVFHPKMCLLFGRKEGMLLVGSGNLTAAGLGNNDELWTAIHLSGGDSDNVGVFADAWAYMQEITAPIRGINAEKIQWVRDYTPWLKELPSTSPGTLHQLESGVSAAFLTNSKEPILKRVLGLIGDSSVKEITAVSPFYDQKGEVLTRLREVYPEAAIRCVVEDRSGTAPLLAPETVTENCTFYAWDDLFEDVKHVNHLHAKLLHFSTDSGEFLLMGSANITGAAMGGLHSVPANGEANVLLYRGKGNWLRELGISLQPISGKHISAFEKTRQNHDFQDLIFGYKSGIRIFTAEIENGTLTLFLGVKAGGIKYVELVDNNGSVVFQSLVELVSDEVKIPVLDPLGQVHLVRIIDEEGNEEARQFVQYPENQYKSCPDPRYERIQTAMAGLGFTTDITDLLELIDFRESDNALGISGSKAYHVQDDVQPDGTILSYDEFNRQGHEWRLEQRMQSRSGTVQIAEILLMAGSQLKIVNQEPVDSDLMGDETDWDSLYEEELLVPSTPLGEKEAMDKAVKEHDSLNRYLKKLLRHIEGRLVPVNEAASPYDIKLEPYSINDLANFVIALQVAIKYGGRHYSVPSKGKGLHKKIFFLAISGQLGVIDNLKAFCIHIIGGYLLSFTPGSINYDEEGAKAKLDKFKYLVLTRILFIVCSIPWREDEYKIKDLLFINAVLYLSPKDQDFNNYKSEIWKSFGNLSQQNQFTSTVDSIETLRLLLLKYGSAITEFNANMQLDHALRKMKKIGKVNKDEFLFSSKLGVCSLISKKESSGKCIVTLTRPGLYKEAENNPYVFIYTLQNTSNVLTF